MPPWRRDFGFDRAVPALAVGATSGVLSIIRALSVSALIFVGDLEPYAAQGTQLGLVSAIVLGLILVFASSYPGSIAMAQIEPAAILALVAAAVVTLVGTDGDADVAFATMTAAIAVASLVFGATLFLLGAFRLGNLVRFIPFPVVAGFLAGVGWLLVRGSFTTLASYPLGFEHLASLSEPDALGQWVPGVAFGILLWFLQRRIRHYLVMPTVMALGIAGFYAVAALTQSDLAALRNRGYLFEARAADIHWQPPWAFFHDVDWSMLAESLPAIGTMTVISVLAFLLLAGSLEVATRRDLDLNRELRAVGIANMVGAGGAAFPGFHSLSGTILAHRMGAPVRLTGLIASLICLAAFLFGAEGMLWLPKTIIGGILFYLGFDLLLEWAYETRLRLSRSEYALVLVVLAITSAIGMLEGLAAGILIGVVLFVVNYSRTSVVRHALSGAEFHSNVDRPERTRAHLAAHGAAIHVLRLQGYIFFGTASRLLALVRARLDDRSRSRVQFVILDFTRVIGLDSSATLGFARMAQYAQDRSFHLAFSGLSPEISHQLGRERIDGVSSGNVRFFPDLDHAMEWCEDRLLERDRDTDPAARDPLADQLRRIAGSTGVNVDDFLSYLEPFAVDPGASIIRQNEESNDLFFIEAGKVSIRLRTADGREARLRSIGSGTVVGEVAFYLDVPRSASVVADLPTTGYRLTRANLERLRAARPDLAAMFHEFIAHRLAARVAETARLVDTLIG